MTKLFQIRAGRVGWTPIECYVVAEALQAAICKFYETKGYNYEISSAYYLGEILL